LLRAQSTPACPRQGAQRGSTGVPHLQENALPSDPTVIGLCLGSSGGPRGVASTPRNARTLHLYTLNSTPKKRIPVSLSLSRERHRERTRVRSSLSLTLAVSLCNSHTHTHTHTLSLSYTHSFSHLLTHSLTHSLTLAHIPHTRDSTMFLYRSILDEFRGGCRVQGAGCRVQGAGCRMQGAGCRVQGAG